MAPFSKRIKKFLENYVTHRVAADSFDPPVSLQGAVLSQWGPGDRFDRVKRDTLSLSLITRGNAAYEQEGRTGVVETGQIFLAHNQCSQTLRTGSAGYLHKRSVILTGSMLDVMVNSLRLGETDVITPRDAARMAGLFRQSHRVLLDRSAGWSVEVPVQALRMLLACAESLSPDFPGQVRATMKFIDSHLHRPLAAAEIARAMGVSERHCGRLFHEHLGCSPMEFCIRQRMVLARNMLANTGQSVKGIAASLGYDNQLYFSAQFRKRVGVCPSAYRRAAWAGRPSPAPKGRFPDPGGKRAGVPG
jgi:AraC-like DNA-binding protein